VTTLPRLLAEAASEWKAFRPEPSADQVALQKRYRSAVAALQARLDSANAETRLAQRRALVEKLALCQEAEAAVATQGNPEIDWVMRWQALPPANAKDDAVIRARFDAAAAALKAGDSLYADMLEANRVQLQGELLRLEVLLGLDSPPELAHERMKVQIEVLQESLAGNKETVMASRIDRLCGLPAMTDEHVAARIALVLLAAAAQD
jgi:hypothetical protein